MTFTHDLTARVRKIFADRWTTREGQVVPDPKNLALANDTVHFDRATILYADLSGSTVLVNQTQWYFAAEVYKTFLHCAATIINREGGTIVSYDGDRVMGIFLGGTQTTTAVRCGLKINYAVVNIINPALAARYPGAKYKVKQVVGIDTSEIRAARTGVRGDNDLVWVGRAANYAAKLTDIDLDQRTWITKQAYDVIMPVAKFGGVPQQNMWKQFKWTAMDGAEIWGSTWLWKTG